MSKQSLFAVAAKGVGAVAAITGAVTGVVVIGQWLGADEWWDDLGPGTRTLVVALVAVTLLSAAIATWAISGQPRKAFPLDTDRRTLERLVAHLPADTIEFIRRWDFGASFRVADIDPVEAYRQSWRRPEKEFLDPQLESLRAQFGEAIERFGGALDQYTWTERPDRLSIPVEWKHTQHDRWLEGQAAVNGAAEAVGATYEALVRAARRRLAS